MCHHCLQVSPDGEDLTGVPDLLADLAAEDPREYEELRRLVLSVQQHHHTATCRKGVTCPCRFKFPRPQSTTLRPKQPCDRGLRRTDLYLHKRGEGDVNTMAYNPDILLRCML